MSVDRKETPTKLERPMCVFNGPAHADSTIISLTATTHPETGRTVHVMGYENTVRNDDTGPNFMILPFPSRNSLGPENVLDTANAKDILKQMVDVVSKMTDDDGNEMRAKGDGTRGAIMFRTGIYWVVVGDPRSIHRMVADLPSDVRPELHLHPEKLERYARMYPRWEIALCCFNNKDAALAAPMMWWYEPMDKETFFVPMLDQHDGKLPDLNAEVRRDHWLVFGNTVDYDEVGVDGVGKTWRANTDFRQHRNQAPEGLRWALPKRITGGKFRRTELNRDYRVNVGVVSPTESHGIKRVMPPGAVAV